MFLSDDAVESSSSGKISKKKVMSLQELVSATELDESDVVAAIQFWIRQQVVRECEPPPEKKSDASMAYGGYGEEDERYYEIIEDQSATLSSSARV